MTTPVPLGYVVEHNLPPTSPYKWSFHPISEGLSFYKDTALQILPVYTEPNPAQPDCRTCDFLSRSDYCISTYTCTNMDQYKPTKPLVLWRTE